MCKRLKSERISVRVTQEEDAILRAKAKQAGMTYPAFLRAVISGKEIDKNGNQQKKEILRELKKIGNNLNQLAYIANSNGTVNAQEYHNDAAAVRDTIIRIERGDLLGNSENDSSN
jgi:hypothetical protein